MRILIIKTSSMGDIIHALPVLDYLRQAHPNIEVDWVVEEVFKDLLEGNPLLRKLHIVRLRVWRKNIFSGQTRLEISALRKQLLEEHYDIVFDIQGNLKSGLIAWATGAKQRVGFSLPFLQESINAFFTTQKITPRTEDNHAGARYLRVVSANLGRDYLGMDLTTDIHTGLYDDAAAESLIMSCGNGPVVLFHGGTTWQTKFWSEEGWISLGRRVHERFTESTILLSWGNEAEREAAGRIAAGIGGAVRLLDRYPLKGISAIIKRVDVVIGGDTGLIHLAAAVGTPTVSYYRASDGSVSGPRGVKHVIVQSPLSCSRCQQTSCPRDVECRASITPDAIMTGIEKLYPLFNHPANGQSGQNS